MPYQVLVKRDRLNRDAIGDRITLESTFLGRDIFEIESREFSTGLPPYSCHGEKFVENLVEKGVAILPDFRYHFFE